MPRPLTTLPGSLIWSGEHWVNFLRVPGARSDSGRISFFHLRYSPAGVGNIALVRIGDQGGFHAICTDNRRLVGFAVDFFFRRVDYFEEDLPVVEAAFSRQGDIRHSPSWTIRAGPRSICSTWIVATPPIIAQGEFEFRRGYEFFTILFFVDDARIELDGRSIPGKPYLRDIWRSSIGGDRSSCVFALAETLIQAPD